MSNKHDLPPLAYMRAEGNPFNGYAACHAQDHRAFPVVRLDDALAAIQRLEAENETLKKDAAGPSLTVSADEHGCAVLEWWNGPKKITLYTVGHPQESLLRVWGPDMNTDMAFVSLMDAFAVKEAFGWLADAAMTKEQKT